MNQHVIVANYQQNILVCHADSAAWATRLRYKTPDILALFKHELPELQTVRVRTTPVEAPRQRTRQAVRVSPATITAIRQVADRIAHPPLQSVLSDIADKLR